MTDAQTQALSRITEIMREHFSSGVAVVTGEMPEQDNKEDIRTAWHGGVGAAMGLLEIGKMQVLRRCHDEDER